MAYDASARRQTGRTTRMLQEACRLRDEGRAVYVLLANMQHVAMYKGRPEYDGLRFETWGSLGPSSLDDYRLRLRGAHPNCILLVDHYAIESRFAAVLRELHRFDEGS